MKTLTLKNYYFWGYLLERGEKVYSLSEWLAKLLLHGKESRQRTRFLKLVSDRLKEIDDERKKMMEENAKKKDGKIVYLDEKGKETEKETGQIKIENVEKLKQQFNDYLNEDYVIDVSPANSEIIYSVRDTILNTEEEFRGTMATRYNEWAEAFEGIKEEPEKKK